MATKSDNMSSSIIQEGDKVVLRKDKSIVCVKVARNRKYQLEKLWFKLDGAIGQPYGSMFEAKGNAVYRVSSADDPDAELGTGEIEPGKDNRFFNDSTDNQKLGHDEISAMRKQGLSGQNIIDQLVENSSTFKEKTEYAQEKYIRRKKKKHVPRFTVLKPSTRLIVEMYFNKGPQKICNLRTDSLSQMLTLGNVRANNKMLVFETCVGLLTGAVMERMGGFGTIVNVHTGVDPVSTALGYYNFPDQFFDILHNFPLIHLKFLGKDVSDLAVTELAAAGEERLVTTDEGLAEEQAPASVSDVEGTSASVMEEEGLTEGVSSSVLKEEGLPEGASPSVIEDENETATEESSETGQPKHKKLKMAEPENESEKVEDGNTESGEAHAVTMDTSEKATPSDNTQNASKPKWQSKKTEEVELRRQQRKESTEKATAVMKEADFDGLLVACRMHAAPVVLKLMDLVAPSRPFVIFSPWQEPLMECYMKLRDRGSIVNMRMTETWWRNYQILPNRTHPDVMMNHYSGYLLSGITTMSHAT